MTCDANRPNELLVNLFSNKKCTGMVLSTVEYNDRTCIAASVYAGANGIFAYCGMPEKSKPYEFSIVAIDVFVCLLKLALILARSVLLVGIFDCFMNLCTM
jgi:hypothetical protein